MTSIAVNGSPRSTSPAPRRAHANGSATTSSASPTPTRQISTPDELTQYKIELIERGGRLQTARSRLVALLIATNGRQNFHKAQQLRSPLARCIDALNAEADAVRRLSARGGHAEVAVPTPKTVDAVVAAVDRLLAHELNHSLRAAHAEAELLLADERAATASPALEARLTPRIRAREERIRSLVKTVRDLRNTIDGHPQTREIDEYTDMLLAMARSTKARRSAQPKIEVNLPDQRPRRSIAKRAADGSLVVDYIPTPTRTRKTVTFSDGRTATIEETDE